VNFLFTDAMGSSLRISPGMDGELNYSLVESPNSYQVVTNFNPSDPGSMPESYPCGRFTYVDEKLQSIQTDELDLTVENFLDILQAVSQPSSTGAYTRYSYVFDITNNLLYLVHLRQFDYYLVIDLDSIFNAGEKYYKNSNLFNYPEDYEFILEKHNSNTSELSINWVELMITSICVISILTTVSIFSLSRLKKK
jgi:hypothetical protein